MSSCRISRGRVAPSESRTDSSFCRAGRPREQQIGDVGADDQQNQCHDHAEDGGSPRLIVLHVVDAAPSRLNEEPGHFLAVPIRRGGSFCFRQRLHVRIQARPCCLLEHALEIALHLCRRGAWLQSAHDLQPPIRRLARSGRPRSRVQLRLERQRNGNLWKLVDRLLNSGELERQDADDRHLHVVHFDDPPDGAGVAAEPGVPELRADHRYRRCRRRVIFRQNRTADACSDTEETIVVAGRNERGRNLCLTVDNNGHPSVWRAGEQIAHRPVVSDELLIHRIGERAADVLAVRRLGGEPIVAGAGRHVVAAGIAQADERVRVLDRHVLQQQTVHGAENGRIRPDAQGQRQKDDGSPAFRMKQDSHRMTNVFQHQSLRFLRSIPPFRNFVDG